MALTRVLVVEDEPEIRAIMAEALADEGYAVACAEDGEQALELLRQQVPDLALVDLMMPGMDGRKFLQACRADPRCASMQILLITAHAPRASTTWMCRRLSPSRSTWKFW